jgi:hypothetical protein
MQSRGHLELGKKVKLFLMFKTIDLQDLVNFWHREGHRFEFQCSGDWKSLKIWNGARPTCQPQPPLNSSCRSAARARDTTCGDVTVTVHRRPMWAGLLILAPRHHQRRPPPISLPPCTVGLPPPRCSALHRPLLHPSLLAIDEPPPSCTTRPKEVPCHRAPPAPRTWQ